VADPRAYRRLADLLRDQIAGGMIAPDEPLPSIAELRRQHAYSWPLAASFPSVRCHRSRSAGHRSNHSFRVTM
jgi:hypothetical protein